MIRVSAGSETRYSAIFYLLSMGQALWRAVGILKSKAQVTLDFPPSRLLPGWAWYCFSPLPVMGRFCDREQLFLSISDSAFDYIFQIHKKLCRSLSEM